MSRSCQSATFSIAGMAKERTMRARPVRFSVSTGLRLCGMADEPFWPGAEILFRLKHFGALQMPDFRRQPLDRGGDHAERREEHGVAVARNDLRRHRLRLQAELRRDMLFHIGVDVGEGADGAGDGAGRDVLARPHQPLAGAGELGIGQRQLDAEGRRLGVDAVAAADGDRVLVLEGAASSAPPAARRCRRAAGRSRAKAGRQSRCRARRTRSCPDG